MSRLRNALRLCVQCAPVCCVIQVVVYCGILHAYSEDVFSCGMVYIILLYIVSLMGEIYDAIKIIPYSLAFS